ncbi:MULTISPECIES: leucyl aminopeptidase [unclassified Corynebacterium]|uniref:leucyl aminopeptidase n=1 Tax=unclassified Corynebacterium TaxID=2624378 RepID=UPI001EF6D358|nr:MULTISPECIES: leucyl aminopeptidase [unclassified Corynebacterium]MCG7235974.1 leucyl aminopeptidase [Corynebacterium sp. ACRQP]MCG7290365.1 leucyl aminopeptidase [Corynebacterium sp. ACRPZ]MCG7294600.1 leucyl aminopeptidase [Corynebacterium sp. ACRPY]
MAFDISLPARGTTVRTTLGTTAPEGAALLVPVANGEDGIEVPVTALAPKGLLEALVAVGAKGTEGEVTRLLIDGSLVTAFGLGNASEIDDEAVRRGVGAAARSLNDVERAAISAEFGVAPVVEGLLLGGYTYTGMKSQAEVADDENSDAETPQTTEVTVVGADEAEYNAAVIVAESVNLARDLVNTPANYLYPESYAGVMGEVAQAAGLDIEVLDEAALEQQGFGGILSVGRGSSRPPRLVHLTWAPSGASQKVALVGKGITFDTGGISLKPGSGMEDMISDMGGSAAQLAVIAAAARLELPVRVDAWLPLAENMPSGTATRPGDVITHYGGITSEVINTDAEGRLVLADAVARACEDSPAYLIETATLTGAQLVALGNRTAGVMGSDKLRDLIAETGRGVGEQAWAMPLLEEQEDELKSPIADIRNTHNARTGGMLFAGLYLSRFVPEDVEWAHIDIAGPAWNGGAPYGYTPKRATGAPVRTIVETLSRLVDKQ